PDPLVRDAALHHGERPPHRDQDRRRACRARRRPGPVHRRLPQAEGPDMTPRHIFREYDIRGLHATELSDDVAESVGAAFGTLLAEEGGARVAVGRDVRPSSVRLAAGVERGLLSAGMTGE